MLLRTATVHEEGRWCLIGEGGGFRREDDEAGKRVAKPAILPNTAQVSADTVRCSSSAFCSGYGGRLVESQAAWLYTVQCDKRQLGEPDAQRPDQTGAPQSL